MNDLQTVEGVQALMRSSKSESEWNANCDKVKANNFGTYPQFWYPAIIISGILSSVQDTWD